MKVNKKIDKVLGSVAITYAFFFTIIGWLFMLWGLLSNILLYQILAGLMIPTFLLCGWILDKLKIY